MSRGIDDILKKVCSAPEWTNRRPLETQPDSTHTRDEVNMLIKGAQFFRENEPFDVSILYHRIKPTKKDLYFVHSTYAMRKRKNQKVAAIRKIWNHISVAAKGKYKFCADDWLIL